MRIKSRETKEGKYSWDASGGGIPMMPLELQSPAVA